MPAPSSRPAAVDTAPDPRAIVVFDGSCVFCSGHARFVVRHDRRGRFLLAAMQGDTGAALFRRFGVDPADPDTLVVVRGDARLRDSDAVLAIWEGLGWPWRAAKVFRILPRAWRDAAYRTIARNRYRLFGRRDACFAPTEAERARVLP